MLENSVESFANSLFLFLSGETKPDKSILIKKHCENHRQYGDFSFPNIVKPWHEFLRSKTIPRDTNVLLMEFIGKDPADFVEESKKWVFLVKKVKIENGRAYVFLDRTKAIQVGLVNAIKINEVITRKMQEQLSSVTYDPLCNNSECLTSLRLKYLCKSVENLYKISSDCRETAPKVFVSSKSSSRSNDRMILCGTVLNAKTGVKESSLTAKDFIRLRQEEMTLIAQHKYGVRVSTDSKWKEFIAHLGESAVIFELLQTKPTSAVKIDFGCSSVGSSKGAAFVLYNCARLETIIRTYSERVNDGTYPPLPDFESTNFSLLTQEDEWVLVFNYILGLPSLLKTSVEIGEQTCEFRPHYICSFLCSMVRVFSQYYRKVRILTEPRQHLLPVIYARIHMLKILNDTLKTCLLILNIKSVSQM